MIQSRLTSCLRCDESRNPQSKSQLRILQRFLRSETIIEAIYQHLYSYPTSRASNIQERDFCFWPDIDPTVIHYARPAISSWATQLVGTPVHKEVGQMAHAVPSEPEFPVHLAASTNGRRRVAPKVISTELLDEFSLVRRAVMYKENV